jgi:hypothetical protein
MRRRSVPRRAARRAHPVSATPRAGALDAPPAASRRPDVRGDLPLGVGTAMPTRGGDAGPADLRDAQPGPARPDAGPLALPASDWALLAADRRRSARACGGSGGSPADRAALALDALARRGLVLFAAGPGAIAGRRVPTLSARGGAP